MEQSIPLHSLVLCSGRDRLAKFPTHEIVDLDSIAEQIVGSSRRRDLAHILFGELRHRVALKLSLGERVVLVSDGLHAEQIRQLGILAENQGASLLSWDDQSNIRSVTRLTTDDVDVVVPLSDFSNARLQAMGWHGVTVVGDVHGEIAPLQQAISWARSRRHFVWLLGDIVDYGEQPLAALEDVYGIVMQGKAATLIGNHERKIARWLNRDNDNLRLSDGNRVTIAALDRLTAVERAKWVGKFRSLLAHSSLLQQLDGVTLTHAAVHPSFWSYGNPSAIEQFALYGEADQSQGTYRRTHDWIHRVPSGQTVIVGHDIISELPMVVRGSAGGQIIFLDTGCGKGGRLSSADLRFTTEGLKLECFRHY